MIRMEEYRMAAKDNDKKIGLISAVSIGIGGMVGGGIFAVLGLAVELTKGGTPLAFLFAGCIALMTSYAYAKLSVSFPSTGGTVNFINQAFGKNTFSGGINNLLWVSYIIMLSLYAKAFGAYAPNLTGITGNLTVDRHIFTSLIIVIASAVNYYSIKVVGRIEAYAVIIKIFILLILIAAGAAVLPGNPHTAQLLPGQWADPVGLLAGGMVIFVAYEGFELIANTAPSIRNPRRNTPLAYYISVISVVAIYICIAVITVGSLPFSQIADAKEFVLAEVARPIFGNAGFIIMTIAALISTFSAINATIYGGSRVSYELAEDDEDPHELTKYLWNQPIGVLITSLMTLAIANTLNLDNIAASGSIGFLLIFAGVNLAAFRLRDRIGARAAVPIAAFALCLAATAVLTIQQFETNLPGILISLGLVLFCFTGEWIFKRLERRHRQEQRA
jgi:amino acid transporter